MKTRRLLAELVSTLHLVATILMAWKALGLVTGCRAPIAVVTSESMEPAFQVGDVLLLWNHSGHVAVGDIAVVSFPTRPLPMVHRIVQSYMIPQGVAGQSTQYIVTKGDNNDNDDSILYPTESGLASRQNVMGVVRAAVPWVGWPIIKMNEMLSRPTRYIIT